MRSYTPVVPGAKQISKISKQVFQSNNPLKLNSKPNKSKIPRNQKQEIPNNKSADSPRMRSYTPVVPGAKQISKISKQEVNLKSNLYFYLIFYLLNYLEGK